MNAPREAAFAAHAAHAAHAAPASNPAGGATRACPVCGAAGHEARPWIVKDGFPLVRCGGCGSVHVGTEPSAIDFASLYGEGYFRDEAFADYTAQARARRAQARRRLFMLRHWPLPAGRVPGRGRWLDVGCAAGFFLAEARRWYAVQGVELSAWASAWARERLALPVFTGTLHEAKLPAAAFDGVSLWDVIEHVPDPVAVLAEAARVLAPGGRLVLTTGDFGSAYARARGVHWHLLTPPWHLTMFTRDTLARAARRAGLVPLSMSSEGVAGDGRWHRSRPGLVLARVLDRGDIVRAVFTR
jgi:SAM-dependent methyltransferase